MLRVEELVRDLRIGISFATILPFGPSTPVEDGEMTRASWSLPVAGLVVGVVGAAVYGIAHAVGLSPGPAAMLALASTIVVTGALHEDGLADTADGLGGGRTRERKLEIMRDCRIGTYGACALVTSLILRWSALAAIAAPRSVMIALLLAHAASRAALPTFSAFVPPARKDGLSASAGQPALQSAAIPLGLGALVLALGFGPSKAILIVILLAATGLMMARLCIKQIGGQTGDILGAFQQLAETAVLLMAAAIAQSSVQL
ncbi:adenosylcobinamide-GDP ribazoletransferase [Bradyrhizobium manausense]|uniref:adenosylcobinamide-GDP ribazoletransferase n=1 Tax=Bradyrhizobium TaxID=374 RepID=UPI001BAB8780|nr:MULTISPECIES: adenosylcobinamide-GDP ribazoletransferase [Bradyrhizobium]MBR0823938.1 adenosylcobinamide-GDP ribazoletransferase [Bradyrhizobium manausense]UVO26355.1 adenosylcobinamide-GDP ribazoletransferase [Bradyrhizobium arachidis]